MKQRTLELIGPVLLAIQGQLKLSRLLQSHVLMMRGTMGKF